MCLFSNVNILIPVLFAEKKVSEAWSSGAPNSLSLGPFAGKTLSEDMRGGGGKAPPRALYTPGSGPLRKSGRPEDYEGENNQCDRPKPTSVQDRLKPIHFNNFNHNTNNSSNDQQLSKKFNEMHMDGGNSINPNHTQGSSKPNHSGYIDSRKKNKKPEQQLYVPKRIKESMVDKDMPHK